MATTRWPVLSWTLPAVQVDDPAACKAAERALSQGDLFETGASAILIPIALQRQHPGDVPMRNCLDRAQSALIGQAMPRWMPPTRPRGKRCATPRHRVAHVMAMRRGYRPRPGGGCRRTGASAACRHAGAIAGGWTPGARCLPPPCDCAGQCAHLHCGGVAPIRSAEAAAAPAISIPPRRLWCARNVCASIRKPSRIRRADRGHACAAVPLRDEG
jgi:hypothetical protein